MEQGWWFGRVETGHAGAMPLAEAGIFERDRRERLRYGAVCKPAPAPEPGPLLPSLRSRVKPGTGFRKALLEC